MNRLAHESSPYLQQHAANPVDWYPWGEEALRKAREEDKPILVSIGYSTCHWCHVMERESFEDERVADFMNAHFVNIKVDREERPDLDAIYMEALSILSGNGGWPLNCFLMPDGRPFYGGTYYPPMPMHRRASWMQVLQHIRQSFRTNRDTVEEQAQQLTQLLKRSKDNLFETTARTEFPVSFEEAGLRGVLQEVFERFSNSFDSTHGGYGRAPKFPATMMMQFVLHYYHYSRDPLAIGQVNLSLFKMIEGGIFDQIGGGFSRYSTDNEWLVPHFEKMLYDNALLVALMADVWRYTREDDLLVAMEQTLDFVDRELSHPDGGFFSALDADSEGEEGKFYVWTKDEITTLLGSERANVFCQMYDVRKGGNWEGNTILRKVLSLKELSNQIRKTPEECAAILDASRAILLEAREKRVRPGLDDKVLLDWNAHMVTACFRAARATGSASRAERAMRALRFIDDNMRQEGSDSAYFHNWKDGQATQPAFLDDYAALIRAWIEAWQYSNDHYWLKKAEFGTAFVISEFFDPEDGFFFFTPSSQKDILLRKKELQDNSTPSGNAMMASNLAVLGLILDRRDWSSKAEKLYSDMLPVLRRFPNGFGEWLIGLTAREFGWYEIVAVGPGYQEVLKEVRKQSLVNVIVAGGEEPDDVVALMRGKTGGRTHCTLYLCRDYACQQPVYSVSELMQQIEIPDKGL